MKMMHFAIFKLSDTILQAYHKQFLKNTKNTKLLTFIEKKFEILYHIKAFQRDPSLAVFICYYTLKENVYNKCF